MPGWREEEGNGMSIRNHVQEEGQGPRLAGMRPRPGLWSATHLSWANTAPVRPKLVVPSTSRRVSLYLSSG